MSLDFDWCPLKVKLSITFPTSIIKCLKSSTADTRNLKGTDYIKFTTKSLAKFFKLFLNFCLHYSIKSLPQCLIVQELSISCKSRKNPRPICGKSTREKNKCPSVQKWEHVPFILYFLMLVIYQIFNLSFSNCTWCHLKIFSWEII